MRQSVSIVDRIPHPVFNGVTRYMEALAAQFADPPDDLSVEFLSWGRRMTVKRWANSRWMRRKFPKHLIAFNRRVLYPLAERRSDAGLLHFPAHGIPQAWLNTRKRCLLSVHGAAAQVAPQWDTDPNRSESLRHSLAAARAADVSFVTFSNFAKDQIVEHYHLDPNRVTVIPHGVDHAHFRVAKADLVADFRAAEQLDRPYLLYVGPCAPRKNVLHMVEAFARLKHRSRIEHEFVIAGRSHPHQQAVAERALDLGVAADVRFMGPVSHTDLPLLYNGASAFAFTSLYEGFGLPVLEAMACGAPVITSALSATGEVAGEAAIRVADPTNVDEISDAMCQAVENDTLRRDLRDAGLARSAEFTWEASADRHLALYRQIMTD